MNDTDRLELEEILRKYKIKYAFLKTYSGEEIELIPDWKKAANDNV